MLPKNDMSVPVLGEVEVDQRAVFEPELVGLFVDPAGVRPRLAHLDQNAAGGGVGDRGAGEAGAARLFAEAALDADRVSGGELLHVALGEVLRLVAAAPRGAL